MALCSNCGQSYNLRRKALGYRTCLDCGSPPIKLPVVPVNKSNYVVGTMQDLKESYNGKGFR